jgi:hypothetical protein
MLLTIAALLAGVLQAPQSVAKKESPSRSMYAVLEPGKNGDGGAGDARGRIVIHDAAGSLIATADLGPRPGSAIGLGDCEQWGWLDEARVFCENSLNPSSALHLVFDAKSGKRLNELVGSGFVWSADLKNVAHFGDVPHLSPLEQKSDSLEIQGVRVYPDRTDTDHHWFVSDLVWSPSSDAVAFVDYRREREVASLIVATTSGVSEYRLPEWSHVEQWSNRDYQLRWLGNRVVVRHRGIEEIVELK